ncbi:hypothetical protein N9R98_01165 [bacterium]|nr:hypothetical protein [bacterium]
MAEGFDANTYPLEPGTHPPSRRDSAPVTVQANQPVHHQDPSPPVIQRR